MTLLRIKVCHKKDVGAGEIKEFSIPGLRDNLLIVNVEGELFALNRTCPHDDVSLGRGKLDGKRIICPGHRYAFDLVSGYCTHDARMRLVSYRVDVDGDDVYISLNPSW